MTRARALAFGVLVCVIVTACGHYGPPSHPAAAPEPAVDQEQKPRD